MEESSETLAIANPADAFCRRRIVDEFVAAHPDVQARVADYLNGHPSLFKVLSERKHEALRGDARMNCALCKYRVRLPGHEHSQTVPA